MLDLHNGKDKNKAYNSAQDQELYGSKKTIMNYQPLGKSSLTISEIGFGCMSLGKDDAYNEKLLHEAIDKGINYFDTADLYQKGQNEDTIGKALRGRRDKVVVATKVGNQWRADGSGWDWNPGKEYILSAVEQSLKRLRTDYIDLYQLHGGTLRDPMDDTIEAFEQLITAGKIRYYGISSIRPNVIREYVKRSRIVSVMMQYSLLDRRTEESCLPLLQENNIAVLARGTMAGGLLVDKPAKPYLDYTVEEVSGAAAAIRAKSGANRSIAQTAICFSLQQKGITAAIAGIRTREQLDEVAGAIQAPPLTKKDITDLRSSIPVNHYEQHR